VGWIQDPSIETINALFQDFEYLAPFIVLLLCGVGLPLPEEVALLGSGLLLYQGRVAFVPISVVCGAAILIGDSAPYWLGRRFGMSALGIGWVRKILHPERFALLEERFERHGNWAIFTCRFLPGLRLPGYFTAGTLKMPFLRFLLLDTLGVVISVPTSIWLGKLFATKVEDLRRRFEHLHLALAFAMVSLILILVVRSRLRRREQQAAARLRADEREQDGAAPRG
jgi:membrane protein DedA with SNARE-associated domain